MSRTIRIKQWYPTSYWGGETYHVGDWHIELSDYNRWYCNRTWVFIHKSDRKAYGKILHERHKESSTANERSPSRLYRKRRESQFRCWSKREIHNYWKDPEYDVNLPDFPMSHLWDWR